MNSLQTAKDALEAELNHVRAGVAHYQARIAQLETALAMLAAITVPTGSATAKAAKPAAAASRATAKKRAARVQKPGSSDAAPRGELPFTGGDFWINLISDQPRSASDILKAAVNSLSFTPTKEQIKKLSSRMIFTLRTLIQTKKIQDSGSGRERRYFKKA